MEKKLKYIVLCVVTLIIVFTNKAQATTAKVVADTLNLRSDPSRSSSVIELLNENDEIEIISTEGDWYRVKHGENNGYVSKEYVKINEENTTSEQPADTTGTEKTTMQKPNDIVEPNTTIKLDRDVTIKILPLINSKDLGTAKLDEEATIITTANNWIFIQTNEISGWIVKDATIGQAIRNEVTKQDNPQNTENEKENTGSSNEPENEKNEKDNNDHTSSNAINYEQTLTKYVNASSVYLRSKASTSSEIVTSLIRNTDVKVTGEEGDWYKVEFSNFNGYIYKELLSDSKTETTNRSSSNRDKEPENKSETGSSETGKTASTNETGLEIVEYARQYLNCPYVYGAAGSESFDCSGFTMYVYKHFGYSLSHSATAQSKVGTYVAKEDLQLGDLVFFLDYETMDGIGHCGIYIGDGNFIHASSGSGYCVKISTLLSGSYYNRYATARRLI